MASLSRLLVCRPPWMSASRALVLTTAAALAVSSCASSSSSARLDTSTTLGVRGTAPTSNANTTTATASTNPLPVGSSAPTTRPTTASTTDLSTRPPETASIVTSPPRTVSTCHDPTGDGAYGFDLTTSAITYNPATDSYLFQVNSIGSTAGWDVGVTFIVGDWEYGISGGQYPDGLIDNWFFDTGTTENTFLPDDAWNDGRFAVTIPADWMPDIAPAAFDWDISITVAGEDVDLCAVEAFGTTGSPT